MDINVVKELIDLTKANDVSALEVEENGFRVRVENSSVCAAAPAVQQVYSAADTACAAPTPAAEDKPAQPDEDDSRFDYIKSPMVGIFNSLEELGKKPLVPGDKISPDTVICGIEAMKMMCDIEAETSGKLVEFMCSDGDQVEFGQLLAKIKKQ